MAYIDTLQAFDELVASGINEKQARTQVNVLDSSFNGVANKLDNFAAKLDTFATKDDIKRLDDDIKDVRSDLKRCLYGIIVGVIVLVLKTAFHW